MFHFAGFLVSPAVDAGLICHHVPAVVLKAVWSKVHTTAAQAVQKAMTADVADSPRVAVFEILQGLQLLVQTVKNLQMSSRTALLQQLLQEYGSFCFGMQFITLGGNPYGSLMTIFIHLLWQRLACICLVVFLYK